MITVIDYGMGNLGSILNMFKKIGIEAHATADPALVARACKMVLPGVGAFDAGMANLRRAGLVDVLHSRVMRDRIPVLGICLGMQLMTRRSAEGREAGLGWIEADVARFDQSSHLQMKVPHMGWNVVRPEKRSELLNDMNHELRFYFVHSYFVRCDLSADVLLSADYTLRFDAAFERQNILGVQFHPEKSHRFGMHLLRNFAERY